MQIARDLIEIYSCYRQGLVQKTCTDISVLLGTKTLARHMASERIGTVY